jgi:hypothetical protein
LETKEVTIPYLKSDHEFHIFAFGDIHAGTIHCVEDDVKRKVREIRDTPNSRWIGMGDYAEWITPKDKRFDPASRVIAPWCRQDNIGEDQTRWIVDLFTPIKDKCIGLLYGNHEDSIRKYNHENVAQNICDRLGVDNLGYSCFVNFIFRRNRSAEAHLITGAFTHGSSGAVTEGAKMMALMRFMKAFDADFYAYAHVHDYMPKSLTRLQVTTAGKIKNHVAIGATTGSWFRTYTQGNTASYGEIKGYPPCELTAAKFTINPNTGEIDVGRSN